jgi:hypothetical protein
MCIPTLLKTNRLVTSKIVEGYFFSNPVHLVGFFCFFVDCIPSINGMLFRINEKNQRAAKQISIQKTLKIPKKKKIPRIIPRYNIKPYKKTTSAEVVYHLK